MVFCLPNKWGKLQGEQNKYHCPPPLWELVPPPLWELGHLRKVELILLPPHSDILENKRWPNPLTSYLDFRKFSLTLNLPKRQIEVWYITHYMSVELYFSLNLDKYHSVQSTNAFSKSWYKHTFFAFSIHLYLEGEELWCLSIDIFEKVDISALQHVHGLKMPLFQFEYWISIINYM